MIQEVQDITPELRQRITGKQAWFYKIIPKQGLNGALEFYIDQSQDIATAKKELQLILGQKVALTALDTHSIEKALTIHYGNNESASAQYYKEPEKFLENMILEASRLNSSDIHIEHYETQCRIRFRVDGKMLERFAIKEAEYPRLINKVKVAAGLDIAEKRKPQDGRIPFNELGESFDIRVSVLPTLYGEKVVMRLLKKDTSKLSLELLGFEDSQLANYRKAAGKPNGIISVSGPTGSGKTTTLYATLKELNNEDVNIVTVEDPIEYTLNGVNHVQTNDKIGLTFASALRSFLRQDPDIIMLGEIRDGETANMAIRAALTGHLVLSTIHTNSAWGTISRLIDMGVPPFLLASTLNISVAQRLVRKLCNHCKQSEIEQDENKLNLLQTRFGINIKEFYRPIGCKHCHHTGFDGRVAIYEVLPIDQFLQEQMVNKELNVAEYLTQLQIKSLADSALELLLNNKTSLNEVYPLLIE